MATFEVRAPLPQFTGTVVGIDFKAGIAQVDTDNDAGRAAYAYFERAGSRLAPVEPEAEADGPQFPPPPEWFDPAAHTAEEVLAHLNEADTEEASRVLDAEAAGKARATVLKQRDAILAAKTPTTPPQGDADQKGPDA
jgi:hypothetical protein